MSKKPSPPARSPAASISLVLAVGSLAQYPGGRDDGGKVLIEVLRGGFAAAGSKIGSCQRQRALPKGLLGGWLGWAFGRSGRRRGLPFVLQMRVQYVGQLNNVGIELPLREIIPLQKAFQTVLAGGQLTGIRLSDHHQPCARHRPGACIAEPASGGAGAGGRSDQGYVANVRGFRANAAEYTRWLRSAHDGAARWSRTIAWACGRARR